MPRYKRPSDRATKDKRWPALRQQALRRDGYKCVQCGAHGRLEVDHIKPSRDYPELAFDLDNLQSLCGSCHGLKTYVEMTGREPDPQKVKWRRLLRKGL